VSAQAELSSRIYLARMDHLPRRKKVCFSLDVPSDTGLIHEVVAFIKTQLSRVDYPLPLVEFDIPLVITEAMANAMIHGNGRDTTKTVTVSVKITPSNFFCVVTDKGSGFDYMKLQPLQDSEDSPPTNGRGVHLIRSLMSNVSFNSCGNQIRMRLKIISSAPFASEREEGQGQGREAVSSRIRLWPRWRRA
jgi:serine/threonine-protein kinase RsbW